MSETTTIIQLLATVVPLLISAVVAITTNKQVLDLKEVIGAKSARIARLEQALIDHGISLPSDPSVDQRADGLNMRL